MTHPLHMPRFLHLVLALALVGPMPAQSRQAELEARPAAAEEPHFVVVRYPQDASKAIAVVGSRTLTLRELVEHLDTRHHPGFEELLRTQPTVQAMLQSDLLAPWVRHFADLEALRQLAGDELPAEEKIEAAQSAALKAAFESYLANYMQMRRQQGRPDPTQATVDRLLTDFQLRQGLSAELQGMLDALEPGEFNRKQLRDFFNANARCFGGQVDVQHILVQHRDAGTGILLRDEGIARANARVAEIKAQLRPDGSNFADLARRYSDDRKTAAEGGLLEGIHRFDDRLPAALCRTAWQLREGDVTSDVIESQYGWHFVRRIGFHQNIHILFTDDAIPTIEIVMRRAMQEKLLFTAREQAKVQLLL